MSPLRQQLEAARDEYTATRYGGDLANELLGGEPARKRSIGVRLKWLLPIAAGALAAIVVIAVTQRRSGTPEIAGPHPVTPTNTSPVKTDRPDLRYALANLRYETYYHGVRNGMQEAVGQIASGVDGALDAPLVTGTVQTARHVAGDLQEVASATWSQILPRKAPGC